MVKSLKFVTCFPPMNSSSTEGTTKNTMLGGTEARSMGQRATMETICATSASFRVDHTMKISTPGNDNPSSTPLLLHDRIHLLSIIQARWNVQRHRVSLDQGGPRIDLLLMNQAQWKSQRQRASSGQADTMPKTHCDTMLTIHARIPAPTLGGLASASEGGTLGTPAEAGTRTITWEGYMVLVQTCGMKGGLLHRFSLKQIRNSLLLNLMVPSSSFWPCLILYSSTSLCSSHTCMLIVLASSTLVAIALAL